ncbi:Purple acid phosphatase 3 [Morus notabilis]|uniref:Purple acid phosphatase n=2 Tax=Morus notabilis TaxID=981085 RepID=W9SG88_9ROSA|nr:Purple acid phosphatase 3 [Morus notabilis]
MASLSFERNSNNKTVALFFFIFTVTLSLCSPSSVAKLQHFHHRAKADGTLSFLVVGDWGRQGLYNQSEVALQMGIVGEKLDIDFVISTGDNFYDDGLVGVDDPAFHKSFSNIYTAPSLQKQWYNVLGNHDYRGNVLAQLSPILRKKDSRFLCLRSFILTTKIVEFFFVDTTPFVDDYFTNPEDHTYDWRGVLPRQSYLSNLLKDVDSALKRSTAKWKIVVGHHAIKSAGHHGNTQELESQLLPILEENNVDFYLNGHDHCLEHIIDAKSQIQFLTSGGGSKAWIGDIKWWNPGELKLYYDGQGFVSLEITKKVASFSYYDVFGNVLHKWTLSKESDSSV